VDAATSVRTTHKQLRAASLLGASTSALLLVSVGVRLIQDIPLFRAVGPLSDPVVAALLTVEIFPLIAGAFLGVAAGLIAALSWADRLPTHALPRVVFGLVLVGGLLLGTRAYPPAQQVGWAIAVLSAASLVAYFQIHPRPRGPDQRR
jgi:hypothetical protein